MAIPPQHLMIIAGEASGDMHAAHLVDEIKKLNPHITFSGLGGPKMEQSGVEIYEDLTRLAVIGFVEVIKHYTKLKKFFTMTLDKVRETKADAVILVDYPGFNLRLAKELKKRNVKVIYYISPQVWAWKANRVRDVQSFTDKMLVLFDFEKDFYAKYDVDVDFVGHPLIDAVPRDTEFCAPAFLESIGLSKDKRTIGILPGSRKKEIEILLPVMLKTAAILKQDNPDIQFILPRAGTIDHPFMERILKEAPVRPTVISDRVYDCIAACDVCMVTSGTATLETAILNKPMVVVYKTSSLTWALARRMVKIPYIALVNIVARKNIVPECLQSEATAQNIADELKKIYTDEARMSHIKEELTAVKHSLGPAGASHRAAREVLKVIGP